MTATKSTQPVTAVPLLDLQAQYKPIESDVLTAIKTVFDSKQFIMGPAVRDLEVAMQAYCGVTHALGVSSGTDALLMALMALDIGPGDEVITSPFTFFATGGSIARIGATPVFIDIEPDTYTLDANQIERAITDRTKAIMPVHLFGQIADMQTISAIARAHSIPIIEDAAQSIGALYNNQPAGSLGDIGCFSFFPSKNLGACGDAGLLTTQDPDLNHKLKVLRLHGADPQYIHQIIGGNFRIDTIQAAILSVKLKYLDQQHAGRNANAQYYNQHLTDAVTKPVHKYGDRLVYNQYTIRLHTESQRNNLKQYLADHNIGSAIYYPIPLHLQQCFDYLGYKPGDCPVAEMAAKTVLSLPIYAELLPEQQDYVIQTVNQFFD